jgi:hypothetical protein
MVLAEISLYLKSFFLIPTTPKKHTPNIIPSKSQVIEKKLSTS